jgi:hypothetical protein
MKISRSILILLFVSSIIVAFSYALNRTNGNVYKSIMFTVYFLAIKIGLITTNVPSKLDQHQPSPQLVSRVRTLSDQEFNSFEDNDQKVILVKTGDISSSVPTSPGKRQPSQFPTPPSGGRPSRNVPGVNPYRTAPKVVPGVDAAANPNPGNGGGAAKFDDQCPVPKKEQSQESNTPNHGSTLKSKKKKKQSKLDKLAKPDLPLEAKQKLLENPQLLELSIDSRNGQIDKQSFDEAESIMQTQRETGLFDDARRPNSEKGERDIDFILSGSLYDEGDIKTPKSFFDTRKGPKKPIPQDMLDYLAKESGAKSILQKQGSESCLHILDLKDIQSHQKESYKANFLQGAREADPELAKHIIVQND